MGEVGQTSEALGTKHLEVRRMGWKTLGCFDKEYCGSNCVDDLVEMRGRHEVKIIRFVSSKSNVAMLLLGMLPPRQKVTS